MKRSSQGESRQSSGGTILLVAYTVLAVAFYLAGDR